MFSLKRQEKVLIYVFFLIVAIKVLLSFLFLSPWIVVDEYAYAEIAESVFHGRLHIVGTTSFSHPYPTGYSYSIVCTYFLGDMNFVYHAMLVLNVFLSTLIIFPAYLISKTFLSEKISLFVATSIAVLPSLTLHNFAIMSENMFFPLFLLSSFLLMKTFSSTSSTGTTLRDKIMTFTTGFSVLLLIWIKATGIAMFLALIVAFFVMFLKNKKVDFLKEKGIVFAPFLIPGVWLLFRGFDVAIGYKTSTYLNNFFLIFTDASSFLKFARVIINEFSYYIIASYFIFMVFTIFLFIYWKKRKGNEKDKLLIFILYSLLSTLFLMIITATHIYKGHWLIYTRYTCPTLPVFFILGGIGLKKYSEIDAPKKDTKVLMIFFALFLTFFLTFPRGGYKFVNNLDLYFFDLGNTLSLGIFSFFDLILILMFLIFLLFIFMKPKLKWTFLVTIIISAIIMSPAFMEEVEDSSYSDKVATLAYWLRDNAEKNDTVVIDKDLRNTLSGDVIESQLWFWWGGDTKVGNIFNTSKETDFIISPRELPYQIIEKTKIVISTWYLYRTSL